MVVLGLLELSLKFGNLLVHRLVLDFKLSLKVANRLFVAQLLSDDGLLATADL
jgi:hypothetical protein